MRDVSNKINTARTAIARSVLTAQPETLNTIRTGGVPKGDPLPVAKVAAIQAAKNTPAIIPYCHPIPIDFVGVEFELGQSEITITVTVKALYKTGVEVEAMTAASVAALTLYDMLKMLDETLTLRETVLVEKTGGKTDFEQPFAHKLRAAVLVLSDSVSSGKKSDRSGQCIVDRLSGLGLTIAAYDIIPDDPDLIREAMFRYCDEMAVDLVVTTGGTGVSPRDATPDVVLPLLDHVLPGVAETIRAYGQERTPYAMLSRGVAGIRGKTLVLCLPGSTGGVRDALDVVFPAVLHAFKMLWGYGHPETARTEETITTSKNISKTSPRTTAP